MGRVVVFARVQTLAILLVVVSTQGLSMASSPSSTAKSHRHVETPSHLAKKAQLDDDDDRTLESMRQSIDNFDAAIVHLLAERFKVTQAVGEYKARVGLQASDPTREARQVQRLKHLAEEAGLDPDFSEKFLRFIVDEVINHHRRIAEEANGCPHEADDDDDAPKDND